MSSWIFSRLAIQLLAVPFILTCTGHLVACQEFNSRVPLSYVDNVLPLVIIHVSCQVSKLWDGNVAICNLFSPNSNITGFWIYEQSITTMEMVLIYWPKNNIYILLAKIIFLDHIISNLKIKTSIKINFFIIFFYNFFF